MHLGQNKWQTKLQVAAQKAEREIVHVGRKMLFYWLKMYRVNRQVCVNKARGSVE